MTKRSDALWSDAVAVTTSDTAQQNFAGLYIGGAGDVTIKGVSGVTVTFAGVPAGTFLPVTTTAVTTATTATDILGLVP